MDFLRYKGKFWTKQLSKIRLLNYHYNDICSVGYFELFHEKTAHIILEALIHDYSVSIWVKEPTLDTAGTRRRHV